MNAATENLIQIERLGVEYTQRRSLFRRPQQTRAVDDVSLEIKRGETLGLVGESGCGKSTLGRTILRLTEPTFGNVLHNGEDLSLLSAEAMRKRRRHLQMIFQDPYSSLDPKMTAGQIVAEPLLTFGIGGKTRERVEMLMENVGLDRKSIDRRPWEFSGGQRQRIGIARALAPEPEFIVADEPISALDVSIQAQILNLMRRLQRDSGLTYLFISHDLRAVRHIADRVAVMYLGRIVELGSAEEIYREPLMPYTQALLSCVPVADPLIERKRERVVLLGDVPSKATPPSGCHFHTRCPYAIDECRSIRPELVNIRPNHSAACIRISPDRPDIGANVRDGLGSLVETQAASLQARGFRSA